MNAAMNRIIRITFLKIGYLGVTTLIDALLDERGLRRDISVRVISSGCKMDENEASDVARLASTIPTDLYVIVSPNAGLPGPSAARKILLSTGKPIILVSDEPSRKITKELIDEGVGYIIIYADSMIGARQEFLDPVEMALYNSDVIRVLSVTGAFRLIHSEIDKVLRKLKKGEAPDLPRLLIDKDVALSHSGLANPYAYAKAVACFEAARRVASLSTEGCYRVEERERYIPIVAAAHELMRMAARLADEAREIEKSNDSVSRVVHLRSGALRGKVKLLEELRKPSPSSPA